MDKAAISSVAGPDAPEDSVTKHLVPHKRKREDDSVSDPPATGIDEIVNLCTPDSAEGRSGRLAAAALGDRLEVDTETAAAEGVTVIEAAGVHKNSFVGSAKSAGRGSASKTGVVRGIETTREANWKAGRLPDGWLSCPPCGEPVVDLLIPCKVPLGRSFDDYLRPAQRFSPAMLVEDQKKKGREIGMVIDLTNTSRYYRVQEWGRLHVQYTKVACKGRDEVPDPDAVNTFCYEVMAYLNTQEEHYQWQLHDFMQSQERLRQHPPPVPPPVIPPPPRQRKYIAVHCTHGHNRTGYMIVAYLLRTVAGLVAQHLDAFSRARPPGIYKPDYISSLFKVHHQRPPEPLQCPPTPEWKRPEIDLNGEAIEVFSEEEDGGGGRLRTEETEGGESEETGPAPMHIDDVLGDPIPDGLQRELQMAVCRMLLSNAKTLRFPGSQPVSLTQSNLRLLKMKYYHVTWKADGTRYMLLSTFHGTYLIDRAFRIRRLEMRFPRKGHIAPTVLQPCQRSTLMDGEMVIDTVPETGHQERRYLIYDLMIVDGNPIHMFPFHKRWQMINDEVVKYRKEEMAVNQVYKYEEEAFRVRRKDFHLLSTCRKFLKEFIPKLTHDADGLIFQSWEGPYKPYTCDELLKWKYPHMNSVDFRLDYQDGSSHLYLLDGRKPWELENAKVQWPEGEGPEKYNGAIIECAFDLDIKQWRFMRPRVDKDTPNQWKVYESVKKSIEENLTEDGLLAQVEKVIALPMYKAKLPKRPAVLPGAK